MPLYPAPVTVLDEDDMVSNSASAVPSQQSVKAYVDTEVAGVTGFVRDFASATRTAGDISLTATAVTAVNTGLDLVLTAQAGDTVIYGINGLLNDAAQVVGFDVYTMVAGSPVNFFGPGLSASLASTTGISGWLADNIVTNWPLTGDSPPRTLVSGDIETGTVTLRLYYAKANTTARTLFAQTNIPLTVWAAVLAI